MLKSKNVLAGALSATITAIMIAPAAMAEQASLSDRFAQASLSALDKVEKVAQENKVQLRAELILLETVIKSIETSQYINESLGLDRSKVYVEMPKAMIAGTAIGGIGGSVLAGRLADLTVQTVTPEKAAWFAEYDQLKAAEKSARKAYKQAVRFNSPDVQALEIAKLEAEKAVTEKLLAKPGNLYRLGRLVRGASRASVVLAGVTLTALSTNETLLLAIGRDEMNKTLDIFKEEASKIEALINQ